MSHTEDTNETEFRNFIIEIASNPARARDFLTTVKNPNSFSDYAASKGVQLDTQDADKIYTALAKAAQIPDAEHPEARAINEDALAEISGGGFFDDVGGFIQDIFRRRGETHIRAAGTPLKNVLRPV